MSTTGALLAFDEAPVAFDRESVRSYDRDGRLHVASTNISKATINEYPGREIPNAQTLGLDPNRKYRMLRDPKELERAAPTFNNLQLLSRHVAVSARDHQPDLVIGSTGTDAAYEHPYLRNSLVLWAGDGIHDVEAAFKKELSCSYHYDADMTPGRYEEQPYDGVMRNIVGNHVALVKSGRAGPDVVVGDEKPNEEIFTMGVTVLTRKAALVQGAMIGYLQPKLAQDAKLPDLTALFAAVKADNYVASKAAIAAGVTEKVKGKLAADAKLDDLPKFLGAFDAMDPAEESAEDEETEEEKKEREAKEKAVADKKAKDAKTARDKKARDAEGETEEEKKAREDKEAEEAKDKKARDKKAKDAECEKEKAMDAAIQLAKDEATTAGAALAIKLAHEIRDAERFARAYVGEMPGVAFDSAEQVFRAALKIKGVKDADKIHASALRTVLEAQPVMNRATPRVAMDAASVSSFDKMYPQAARIGRA